MISRKFRERGQALFLVTVSIIVAFGLLGLVVDLGWMHFRHIAAQTAADAAASAAVQAAMSSSGNSFSCGSQNVACQSLTACPDPLVANPTNTVQIACAYAKSNGFVVTHGGRQTVSVEAGAGTAPPTAPGVTASYWITVRAAETVPQLFSAVLGNMTGTVGARATAVVSSSGGAASCVYVLDPSAAQTFTAAGGATVNASCGIFVNSNHATDALDVSGGAVVNSSQINVVGGYKVYGGAVTHPTPTSGVAPSADPFASLPTPSFAGCDHNNTSIGNGATVTLSPGVYCNGITLGGGSHVTFQAGLYIVNGGGVTMGNGVSVTGSGVTIFNTAKTGYTPKPFNIAGGSVVTLAAPTAGTWRGVLFYGDRNVVMAGVNTFAGGTIVQLTGSLYFPESKITYAGGSSTSVTAIIAKKVTFSNGSYLAYDVTGQKTGLGRSSGSLVE